MYRLGVRSFLERFVMKLVFWSLKEALSKVLAKAGINRILQISGFKEFDGKVHALW